MASQVIRIGSYAGAARKAADLKALGITAIDFLPVFEFQNDTNGLNPKSAAGDNYWGYDPDSFFAPDRRYAADKQPGGPSREFRAMVRAFHDQGLKILLDVVYRHVGFDAPTRLFERINTRCFVCKPRPTRYFFLTAFSRC
jgi:isoamylase